MRHEYVTCIADTQVGKEGLSWCGRMVSHEFHYTDIDHAAFDGRQGGRLVACQDCVRAVAAALRTPPEVGRIDGLKRALQILSEEYGDDGESLTGFKRIQMEIDTISQPQSRSE